MGSERTGGGRADRGLSTVPSWLKSSPWISVWSPVPTLSLLQPQFPHLMFPDTHTTRQGGAYLWPSSRDPTAAVGQQSPLSPNGWLSAGKTYGSPMGMDRGP